MSTEKSWRRELISIHLPSKRSSLPTSKDKILLPEMNQSTISPASNNGQIAPALPCFWSSTMAAIPLSSYYDALLPPNDLRLTEPLGNSTQCPPMELPSSYYTPYDTHFAFPMTTHFQGFHDAMIMESSELQEVQQITDIGIQAPQHDPFVAQGQPVTANSLSHLNSSGSSINSYSSTPSEIARPMRMAAEGGNYTCTYHGCTLRFETPALLQKHKREGHRRSHSLTVPRPHNGTTSSLLNSQARTHSCDRINPTTGKPCNTFFSRLHHLTRHEDTIHNPRRQKVRCDVCTEEKTFSRADALRRHYRLCHPDMDLHGCYRRLQFILKKHREEGYRRSHSLTVPRPHNGTTSSLLNSQAGPHRCGRINPTTGKPCNTIFSRSYTLTRHEKTIHNPRKEKVRCTICTKDKSYSRIDTLRTHYRDYHPGMDLPSKHQ